MSHSGCTKKCPRPIYLTLLFSLPLRDLSIRTLDCSCRQSIGMGDIYESDQHSRVTSKAALKNSIITYLWTFFLVNVWRNNRGGYPVRMGMHPKVFANLPQFGSFQHLFFLSKYPPPPLLTKTLRLCAETIVFLLYKYNTIRVRGFI